MKKGFNKLLFLAISAILVKYDDGNFLIERNIFLIKQNNSWFIFK